MSSDYSAEYAKIRAKLDLCESLKPTEDKLLEVMTKYKLSKTEALVRIYAPVLTRKTNSKRLYTDEEFVTALYDEGKNYITTHKLLQAKAKGLDKKPKEQKPVKELLHTALIKPSEYNNYKLYKLHHGIWMEVKFNSHNYTLYPISSEEYV
jgi:hypothetical protein